MAIDKLTLDFLEGLHSIEAPLEAMHFVKHSFFEKGFAYYIEFRRKDNTRVEFIFGPSDWDIEMIVYTSMGKFAFKDLLAIPEVRLWVNENKYEHGEVRNMKSELSWFGELLRCSLPHIE